MKENFCYHWICSEVKVTYLYFAKDLFLFYKADLRVNDVIKQALNLFHFWAGLKANETRVVYSFLGLL